jgi:hypothetical protein
MPMASYSRGVTRGSHYVFVVAGCEVQGLLSHAMASSPTLIPYKKTKEMGKNNTPNPLATKG